MGKDGPLCMCGFILRIRQCCDSHEDDGFAFHWSGQDGHQKIPNVLPVQLGVGPAWGLQGIGSQGNRLTEFRQPLQEQSHLEMPGILVQLGHIQRT